MTKIKTPAQSTPSEAEAVSVPESIEANVEETPFEAVASICSVLVVGLFILTMVSS